MHAIFLGLKRSHHGTWLLDGMLHRLRRAFFDSATLDYPWNPHCVEDVDLFDAALEELEAQSDGV